MIRAVVDTNALIRALIKPQGTVGPILSRLAAGEFALEASDEAGASWIVTGDQDLLVLGRHGTARIDTPAAFLAHLERCRTE